MNRIFATAIALLLGCMVGKAPAQAPIPSRPLGFLYGSGSCSAPVHLEAWVDLVCTDSKAAWPTYQKVAEYYGPQKVRFTALMFPLPYHRAAMLGSQATYVVNEMNSSRTFEWLDTALERQAILADNAIFNQPQGYIVDTYSDWAADLGFSREDFKDRLAWTDPTNVLAGIEFKYGTTRGVYQTPQTFINGVTVNASPTWTLQDWEKIIDPLLKQGRK